MNIKTSHTVLAFALISAAVAAACGGSQPEPESPPAAPSASAMAPAETPPATPAAADTAAPSAAPAAEAAPAPATPSFKDMTDDERKELMKTQVLPQMTTAFQGLDAKRFAEVRCTTCHGEGAKQGKFTMPNPKLPKLDPKDGFAKHMKKNAEITKFMMEHVVPDMAKILGMQPYNPETKEGFGCFNCHTMAGK